MKEEDLLKKTRGTGIAISYLNTLLNMIFGLILSSFLLRKLGDTEYGLYQTISSFASYLVMLEFGTGTVMARNIAVNRSKNDDSKIISNVSTIWYLTLFLSLLILIVSAVFYFNIQNIYRDTMTKAQVSYSKKIFLFIIAYLVVSFFTQALNGFLLGMENYTFSQTINFIKLIVRTCLLIFIISLKPYAIFIAIIDMCISFSLFISTFFYSKKRYKIKLSIRNFDKKILKESLPLCFSLMLQTIVNQANNSVDKFIIGIKLSMETVALYSVSQYIYSIFSSVTTIPITMYLPQVAKDLGKGLQGKELTDTLIQPCRLICLVGGTILFGFFAVGEQFIIIIYGNAYKAAWIYALIIMIPMFINMANGILINVLDVLKKRHVRSYILLGTTILNITLTIILISDYQIMGAVIATAISTCIGQVFIMNLYYSKILGIKIFYLFKEAFRRIIPIEFIIACITFLFGRLLKNIYLSFIISGGCFVLLSVIFILNFGLNSFEKIKIKEFWNRIRRGKEE